MAVLPVFPEPPGDLQYLTLSQAQSRQLLTITEVSEAGSVPNLKAVNKGDVPVLLLDGEELAGAKQNRVLNASILLREKSETIIPVTCTEQGRWNYLSPEFHDSGEFLAKKLHAASSREVAESLAVAGIYHADQSRSWARTIGLMEDTATSSPTAAMRDVYRQRRPDLDEYLKAFICLPGQRGLLVFIAGEILGFDTISQASAYRELHGKFIRSYAMEAIRSRESVTEAPTVERARAFLAEAGDSEEKSYDSVGYGRDHRFTGTNLVGSALIHKEEPIHVGFFRIGAEDQSLGLSRASQRRRYRL